MEYVETLYLNKFIYTFEPNGLVTEEIREEMLKNNPPQPAESTQKFGVNHAENAAKAKCEKNAENGTDEQV